MSFLDHDDRDRLRDAARSRPAPQPRPVTYVSAPSDLPPGEHHCILTFDTVVVSGCGYPDSVQPSLACAVYPTRDAWLAEIDRRARLTDGRGWVAMVAHVPVVTASVKVDVR